MSVEGGGGVRELFKFIMGTKITDVWLLNSQKMPVKNSVLESLAVEPRDKTFLAGACPQTLLEISCLRNSFCPPSCITLVTPLGALFCKMAEKQNIFVELTFELISNVSNCTKTVRLFALDIYEVIIESGSSLQQLYQRLIITHLCFIYFNNSFCVFDHGITPSS